LMVIASYAGLLKQKAGLSASSAGFLDEIHKAEARAVLLTDQLLAFAQRQVLQPVPVDLVQLIRACIPRLKEILGSSVRLEEILPESLPNVQLDEAKFALALEQLALNARDVMPNGGTVIIEAAPFDDNSEHKISHSWSLPGPFVQLTFSDTGEGMRAEQRDRIFDPCFTTKAKGKGSGMGMAVVYGLIRQLGGDIACESQPMIGTTIRMLLPVTSSASRSMQQHTDLGTDIDGRGRTILVIEDEQAVLSSVGLILRNMGFDIISAESGESALATVAELSRAPDLIISDVVLPGIDGRQTVHRIHAMRPGIPVIFMSGFSNNVLAHHGVLPKELHFIPKPFDIEVLISKIRSALEI